MPHTNRARRADHYRSIDGKGTASGSSNPSTATSNNSSSRRHSHHEQEDSSALNSSTRGGGPSSSERHGGRSAGRGRGGRGPGGGRQTANGRGMGRGGGSGRPSETDGVDPPPAGGSKGKSKNPSVKNRIRGLTRLMNKPGIEEEQRLHLQQQVAELEGRLSEREKHERERALAIKYHKAKFFDRRKALRRLAQIHRKLKGDIEESARAELEQKRESEEADLKYVLYFPKDKKYLPLGKGKEGPPRAQRSHERFLKEALSRGEAAGWTEFQENLDKFVTNGGGTGTGRARMEPSPPPDAGGDARLGNGRGLKRKKVGLDALPVVAQEKLWDDGGGDASNSSNGQETVGAGTEGSDSEEDASAARSRTEKGKKQLLRGQQEGSALEEASGSEGGAGEDTSDSEGEISGDEGFGAAASDEEDAYSFAEARMKWASGGGGAAKSAAAAAAAAAGRGGDGDGSGSDSGKRSSGAESDGHDSDDSVGDIYADAVASSKGDGVAAGAGGGLHNEGKGSADNDVGGSSGSESDSDGDEMDQQKASLSPSASDSDGAGQEESGGEIELNDDFFMEEKGSDTESQARQPGDDADATAAGKNSRARRDARRNSSGESGRGRSAHRGQWDRGGRAGR
ncbi:unnamed protein product, partial [Scytosiphon promiscuus]